MDELATQIQISGSEELYIAVLANHGFSHEEAYTLREATRTMVTDRTESVVDDLKTVIAARFDAFESGVNARFDAHGDRIGALEIRIAGHHEAQISEMRVVRDLLAQETASRHEDKAALLQAIEAESTARDRDSSAHRDLVSKEHEARREDASALRDAIAAESQDRKRDSERLETLIAKEHEARREDASALRDAIAAESQDRKRDSERLETLIAKEHEARREDASALRDAIAAESQDRKRDSERLETLIAKEHEARREDASALRDAIGSESEARTKDTAMLLERIAQQGERIDQQIGFFGQRLDTIESNSFTLVQGYQREIAKTHAKMYRFFFGLASAAVVAALADYLIRNL